MNFILENSFLLKMSKEIDYVDLQKLVIKNACDMGFMGSDLAMQNVKITGLEDKIKSLQKTIELKNKEIRNLEKILEKIYNSTTWKTLRKFDRGIGRSS